MVLADYSDMEQEIQETPDQAILPRGTEAKLRVIAVYPGQNEETEVRYYRILFDIPDMPEVKEIQRFFNDLADGDKMLEKHFMAAKRAFRDFAKAFGLDYSKPFDWEEDLVGLEGDCILGVKKDEEYGDSNTISRFVTGK